MSQVKQRGLAFELGQTWTGMPVLTFTSSTRSAKSWPLRLRFTLCKMDAYLARLLGGLKEQCSCHKIEPRLTRAPWLLALSTWLLTCICIFAAWGNVGHVTGQVFSPVANHKWGGGTNPWNPPCWQDVCPHQDSSMRRGSPQWGDQPFPTYSSTCLPMHGAHTIAGAWGWKGGGCCCLI